MIITDETQLATFIKFIHDNNQHLKNIYNGNTFYKYHYGNIVCNGTEQLAPYVTVVPQYTKKNEWIKEIIQDITFIIDGIDFFQFHKSYKKDINEIVIDQNVLWFKTSLPLVEIQFISVDKTIVPYSLDTELYEELAKFELSEELARTVGDLGNKPFTFYFDFDEFKLTIDEIPSESYLPLTLNKKFLIGYKNTIKLVSDISFIIYDYNSENNLYLVKMCVKNKDIAVYQYMVLTDVLY